MKGKVTLSLFLIAILLSTFIMVNSVVAGDLGYQNISVQDAKNIIRHTPGIIILDVRNQSEYDLGHTYNATLLPVFTIENQTRIVELPTINDALLQKSVQYTAHEFNLSAHMNDKILVYCKGGSRSAVAAGILVAHGFAQIYNMIGGIDAWMTAGYDIYTTNHFASVNVVDKETTVSIEPWLQYIMNCSTCQNGNSCSTNQTPLNANETILEQNGNHTLILKEVEINGTVKQFLIEKNIAWQSNESYSSYNRTLALTSIIVTTENASSQSYALSDKIDDANFSLSIDTLLTSLNSSTYNQSATSIEYIPKGPKQVTTTEDIAFNSSVTLSQLYKSLSKASNDIGKLYKHSKDSSLIVFGDRYSTIADELRLLSHTVKTQMSSYDKLILYSTAVIKDGFWTTFCTIFCPFLIIVGCGAACIGSGGAGCLFCGTWGSSMRLGCVALCGLVAYMENGNQVPPGIPPAWVDYVVAATWYPQNSPTAHVWNEEGICQPNTDNNFVQIYAGNWGDEAMVVCHLDTLCSGNIVLTGYSELGYCSDYQIWVSYDNQNWGQAPIYEDILYFNYPIPYNLDFAGGYAENINYIAIVCYDYNLSCNLFVDAISVTQ